MGENWLNNHEEAGRSTMEASRLAIREKAMNPRSICMARVPRTINNAPKITAVTNKISIMAERSSRSIYPVKISTMVYAENGRFAKRPLFIHLYTRQ